ncbi:MAG: 50S ribosomal protein L9 [Kiritimatiellia bacterium]
MAVEVLLMADVKGLGVEGDTVRVADGYARNYLFPQKLAAPVTPAMRRQLAKMQREREEQRRATIARLRELAERIAAVSCTIAAKTTGEDKLYGSVGAAEIVAALKLQGIEVDRHSILLDEPIKQLGVYEIKVKLHPEVETAVKVWVVEE